MTQNFAIYPSLNGKTVFVSGGAQGIGAEIVRAFAAQGAKVGFLDIDEATSRALADDLPGVTVARVTTKATIGATGATERKFNLRWQRQVRTLASTTLSASRNFARALAHLFCVAGEDLAELDTTTLAAINTALGETSALLRFDGSLDDAEKSLGERMQLIANHARCVLWRNGTQWTVTRDQAPAIHVIPLDDSPATGKDCTTPPVFETEVEVADDDGTVVAAATPLNAPVCPSSRSFT